MPRYTFECDSCQLQFDRVLRVGENKAYACPECKEPAPQVMSGFGFAFTSGSGATANSGVHADDYPTADRAVGRSADEGWSQIRARERVKKEAREKGETQALIRRTGADYIDYEPMSDRGRDARRGLAKEAISKLKRGEKAP